MRLAHLAGWRRDLLVGLVASCLTVLILLPVGWALLHEERQQTAAAHSAAEQALQRAQQSEAESAQYKAQAEENFRLARGAVDECFTAAAGEPEPTDQVRKRLLEEAERFYQQRK